MNGGKIVCHEGQSRFFYQRLKRGECLVMAADLPANGVDDNCLAVSWLGKDYQMAAGALRLARKTNSLISAFFCLYRAPGKYQLYCISPREATQQGIIEIYQFIEHTMQQSPYRWWAGDMMNQYIEATADDCKSLRS